MLILLLSARTHLFELLIELLRTDLEGIYQDLDRFYFDTVPVAASWIENLLDQLKSLS
jgi:hypothetical protein